MTTLPPNPASNNNERAQRRRIGVFLAALVALLAVLTARLVQINTTLRPHLLALAEQQQRATARIPARRGMIVDARGRTLAVTRQAPDVFIDPLLVEDLPDTAARLAARINVPAEHIVHLVSQRPQHRFVVVAERVDEITADAVRNLNHPAIGLSEQPRRTYPVGDSMGHVLGFVGKDGHGLEGIELAHDEHLRGTDGRRVTVRDARRRALGLAAKHPNPPVDGGHVVLTLDAEIQRIAEGALATTVAEFHAQSAVAIVLAPHTGDLLAVAVVPGFDPARAASVPPQVRRNRAFTDPTEPGSAFKPIIACGALDGGFLCLSEKIDCHNGVHYFGQRRVTDTKPQGRLDLTKILTYSSNIGMGIIAHRMGNEALHHTIRRFGFGQPTAAGFPGEDAGLVYPLQRWTTYSTNAVAIGYEVAATPIQLAAAFAAIIHDGVLLRPRLVRSLLAPDGRPIRQFEGPDPLRRAASLETAHYMVNEALPAVVEEGSAHRVLGALPYRILGKTGTAKLPFADRRGYEPGAYVSTFVGAAPAPEPEIVALVMVRRPDPARGYYGSTVAAPAAGRILTETLAYLGVPPSRPIARAGL